MSVMRLSWLRFCWSHRCGQLTLQPKRPLTWAVASSLRWGKLAIVYAGAKIVGKAQSTGTLGHALVSKSIAYFYALNPNVQRVTLDLATGN